MARILETNHTSEDQSPNFSLFTTLSGHKGALSSVKFSPCGQCLASCSYDKVIKLWSADDGQTEENLIGHKKGISDVSWSHDSCQLVSASDDKTLKLWNIATATCVKTLKGHQNVVFCTAFSAKSNLIISGSDDESAKVWDARTCKCVRTLNLHADRVTARSAERLREVGHDLPPLYQVYQMIRSLLDDFRTTVQAIYRWSDKDFVPNKIKAELLLEENSLGVVKKDLEDVSTFAFSDEVKHKIKKQKSKFKPKNLDVNSNSSVKSTKRVVKSSNVVRKSKK
ncbi:retrovirus-related Pol polyprotein from transposon TNT 1-94 [Trichonephila clavata]|uniref:Retrovirus-related Pol polyprotein from transposon TNT 1-94 n=1 Tax=Trichonephila clavata TaxID=2740835 RepID=A0A8X6JCX1_TRICU|nr:retrovirus-related Pol polyprotein from transposon TNT 1-94 [Trichonephila clavata]